MMAIYHEKGEEQEGAKKHHRERVFAQRQHSTLVGAASSPNGTVAPLAITINANSQSRRRAEDKKTRARVGELTHRASSVVCGGARQIAYTHEKR